MNTLQTWMFVGIPALVLAAGLFAGRSTVRAAFGYVVLILTLLVFLLVPRSPISAGTIGMIAFLLVAAGRGFAEEEKKEDYGQLVPDRTGDEEVEEPRRV